MNEGIDVRQDDILWRFYCKRFAIDGEEFLPPKNLCQYFWTSMQGLALWIFCEVKLQSFWLIHFLTIAVFGLIASIRPDASNAFILFLLSMSSVLCGLSLTIAIPVTLFRVRRAIKTRAPWIGYLLFFGFIILVLTNDSLRAEIWSEESFSYMLNVLKFMLASTITTVVVLYVLTKIPHRRLEKIQTVIQTFIAFARAKKTKVCPPVNPPEDFKPKQ